MLRAFLALTSASLLASTLATPRSSGCVMFEQISARRGVVSDDGNPCTTGKTEGGLRGHDSEPREGFDCLLEENPGTCSQGVCTVACAGAPESCKCEGLETRVLEQIDDDRDCQRYQCSGPKGMIISVPVDLATPCVKKSGFCNGNHQCVDCFTTADWIACGGTKCSVKLCQGETCTDASGVECKSGNCIDGYCCADDCKGTCMSCGLAESKGTCTNIAYYNEDQSYEDPATKDNVACDASTSSTCDGYGQCLRVAETPCNEDRVCVSGKCLKPMGSTQGICLGAAGETCANNSRCVSNQCVGGKCKGKQGDSCHVDPDCQSGMCVADKCN